MKDDLIAEIGNQRGQAIRFTDIDGIGPATADKITSVRGVNAPRDVEDMSADELADKAGISYSRAEKAIRSAGGNPNVSKREQTGTVSAAGIRHRQGDFWVEFTDLDKARARNDARSRSETAVRVDEQRRAPINTDYDEWKENPGRWDYPGVDTPSQDPRVREKDYKAGGEFETAEFDERGRAEYDEPDDTGPQKRDAASGKKNFILQTADDRIPASEITDQISSEREFMTMAEARDVSLAPEEAFRGVGLGTPSAPGGQAYNAIEGRPMEIDRPEQEQEPPTAALRKQRRQAGKGLRSGESGGDQIAFVYESEPTVNRELSLRQFKRRVRRKKREMGGMADDFAAASLVAEEMRGDGGNGDNGGRESTDTGPNRRAYNLPAWTQSRLQTELNRQVYQEGNNEFEDLRERVKEAGSPKDDTPVMLSSTEHARVTQLLKDRKERTEDLAERKEANIFGDTEEQAEIDRKAFRGLMKAGYGEEQ